MVRIEHPAGKKIQRSSRAWRIANWLLRVTVGVYLGICLLIYFAQNWIAFPGASYQGKPETAIAYSGPAEMVHLTTADGTSIAAIFGTALTADGSRHADPATCPTILYFYGNAGSVAWSENEFDHMRKLGANVLIPDLAGFGASGGKASEASFYATADTSWDYLMHRPGVDPTKIITAGWSMGAGVAVDLAHHKPVAGMAMFNAFTDLPAMAHHIFPWLPTSLLLKYRFDNVTKIKEIRCPTFICNGALDTLVAPEMSDRLAAAAGGPVTRLRIQTADHNSIFAAEPETVWPELEKFIAKIAIK